MFGKDNDLGIIPQAIYDIFIEINNQKIINQVKDIKI
jgi:hypothetical protein